jgi:fatty acid desaturase
MAPPELRVATTTAGGPAALGARRVPVEYSTLLLILADYAAWLAITFAYPHWSLLVVAPIAAVLVTLHGSLQHEIVHGHPTRWPAINRALGMMPLSFWLPFERYRRSHRIHHKDLRLTDPLDDPESYYWTPEDFARLLPHTRLLLRVQQTLAGRVLVGSWWSMLRFAHLELRLLIRNEDHARRDWLEHLLWCVPVVLWLKLACGMPVWLYFVAIVIPSNGLVLVRSFAEHRARPEPSQRVAVVEDSWILGPLYLFNNLHSLHHETPLIPWYELPARYRANRERLLAENGGLVYRTYFEVARRFLFRAHDDPRHPTGRVPAART